MSKILRCNELMPGCPYEAKGATQEAVMGQAAEHARTVHNISQISPELAQQVRGAIRDE